MSLIEEHSETIFSRLRNRLTSSVKKLSSSENEINNFENQNSNSFGFQRADSGRERISGGIAYYDKKKRSTSLRLRRSTRQLNPEGKLEFFKSSDPIITLYPFANDDKNNDQEKVSFFLFSKKL